MSSERKTESFFDARLTCMLQVITFSELSSSVGTAGTGLMLVLASRVAISYGCPALF
jgi:hypothetical protein